VDRAFEISPSCVPAAPNASAADGVVSRRTRLTRMLFFQGYAHDGHDGNSAQSAVDGNTVQNDSIARPPSDPAPPLPTMAFEQSASRPHAGELSQIEVATAIGNISKSDGPTSSVAAGGSPVPIKQATGLNSISNSVSLPVPVNSGVSLSSAPVTLASETTPAIAVAATGAIAVSVFDVVSSDFSTHTLVFFLIAWNLKAGQQQGWLLILLPLLTILNRAMMLSKYRPARVVISRSSHLKLLQH